MARAAAVDLLETVLERKRTLDDAETASETFLALSPRDRALANAIVITTLRHLGEIDAIIDAYLEKPLGPKARPIRHILRSGLAQFLFLGIPDHAAVSETVDLCRGSGGVPYKKLVNAILRRTGREGAALLKTLDAPKLNTPAWLWERWVKTYGEETTRNIAARHMVEPHLDLAVKSDPAGWAAKLGGTMLPTGAVRLNENKGRVSELEGYEEGEWWVQDAAAQLPVRLLGDVSELNVIDLCAAPGGKTLELAALGAHVTSIDRSEKRLRRVGENLERTKLRADLVTADAATWRPKQLADVVLLDAPCSSTGTLRRHPDVAYLKSETDIQKLAAVQTRLLHGALEMVKPGGRVVYCTCSLEPEEGENQIATLLKAGAPVTTDPMSPAEAGAMGELVNADGQLRTLPSHLSEIGGLDGFFAARLKRL